MLLYRAPKASLVFSHSLSDNELLFCIISVSRNISTLNQWAKFFYVTQAVSYTNTYPLLTD